MISREEPPDEIYLELFRKASQRNGANMVADIVRVARHLADRSLKKHRASRPIVLDASAKEIAKYRGYLQPGDMLEALTSLEKRGLDARLARTPRARPGAVSIELGM